MLVGTFVGVMGWRLADSIREVKPLEVVDPPPILVVPPPQPPAAPHRDAALAAVLHRQVPTVGTVALYAKSLTTGAEAEAHGERVFPAASLYKLPVLVEVIRQARLGHFGLSQELLIGREHWVSGSGVLQGRVGDRIPIRELLRLMIVESDNIAAMRLLDFVGLDEVNQTLRGMGLRSTRLIDWRAPGAYDGAGPYVTSANDMGLLFEIIANGRLVDNQGSDEAIRLLERPQTRGWLGDALPSWVRVAHKWGELPGARHDAGIVFAQHHAYVMVVLTEGVDANLSGDLIRGVSRAVFAHFESGE